MGTLTPPEALLDASYLDATAQHLDERLRQARHDLNYFLRDIRSLTEETQLPPAYRAAYGEMCRRLEGVLQAIRDAEGMETEVTDLVAAEFAADQPDLPPAWSEAAQRVIAQINQAEKAMLAQVKVAQAMLLERQPDGLFDWHMPFDYDFHLLLDSGPSRRFYATCGHGGEEPLRISIPWYQYGPHPAEAEWDACNRNIFSGFEGHPLQAGHHGCLVHCILDHSALDWRLLPFIREIEVKLAFSDFETLWVADANN